MDERQPPPSVADDPDFQADLDALDHGMTDRTRPRPSAGGRPPAAPNAAASPPTPAPTATAGTGAPFLTHTGARRPLLDLFPPPPQVRDEDFAAEPIDAPRHDSSDDVDRPDDRRRMTAFAIAVGVIGGAAVAAWLFRDRVSTILSQLHLLQ